MSDVENTERGSSAALGAYLIVPVIACGLTVYYLVSTAELVWEARATGIFISVILLLLCSAQFVRIGLAVVRGKGSLSMGDLTENNVFNRQRLALGILILLFVSTLEWVGTTLGLILVLIGSMWVLGVRKIHLLVSVALTTAIVVHVLLIKIVGSRLPQGIFKNIFSLATGGG